MKLSFIFILFVFAGCTKSETQYRNEADKRSTVNDRKSDTIHVIPEVSDTSTVAKDSANVH